MTRTNLLSQAISSRLDAISVLREAIAPRANNAHRLREASAAIEVTSGSEIPADTAAAYGAYADLLAIAAALVEWRHALIEVSPDAERYLKSVAARTQLWIDEYGGTAPEALVALAAAVTHISFMQEVGAWLERLALATLPVVFYEKAAAGQRVIVDNAPAISTKRKDVEVAFVTFCIDDEAVETTHYVTPTIQHDLSVEVRVSRWPDGADRLRLLPISIEDRGSFTLPTFEFDQPSGHAPFTLKGDGRAILKYANALGARPYEFKYSAHFLPPEVEQPVAVVGQRTLRLEGIDFARTPITGFPSLDKVVHGLRPQLRQARGVMHDEAIHFLTIITALLGCSARSMMTDLFEKTSSEAQFQSTLANELRRDPSIGADLEEHPHVGRGIADLAYKGIRIELKLEKSRQIGADDIGRFIPQTRAYVTASGRRLGLLCVLDVSTKTKPVVPAETLFVYDNDGVSCIGILVIQGNLPLPSDYSR